MSMGDFFIRGYMKTLVTKRLILRALRLDDAPSLFYYGRKPNIGPMAGWPPHKSIEESYKILKIMRHEEETWAITLKTDDTLIGTIGLTSRDVFQALDNTKELGYALDDTYWGQGIIPEAAEAIVNYGFIVLELDKILCGHYGFNLQSKRVIEKLGFHYDHTEIKKDYKKQPIDVLMYKLDRYEYLERRFKHDNT